MEETLRRTPMVQCALRRDAVAAVRVRPKTFGTLQGIRIGPVFELVVNVRVASPVPTVIVAVPAVGVLEEMTLVVPALLTVVVSLMSVTA